MSYEISKAKRKRKLCIELHAIQSFPPSNLNRDEAGYPKEAPFGGVRRGRVSSQAWKYAIRHSDVIEDIVGTPLGIRTKRVFPHVVEQLARDGIDEDWAAPRAKKTVDKLYTKEDSKSKRAKQLAKERAKKRNEANADSNDEDGAAPLYVSFAEIQSIVRFLADAHANDAEPDIQSFCKEQVKALRDHTEALDIALFGRMLAGRPELNIEAACRFAHAISTHEVSMPEADFFTAVDDLLPAGTRGAAMMGETYYNSATYYRNSILDWGQLVANLGGKNDLARSAIRGFMAAFAFEVPKGMQNSFVNQHWPALLMTVARPDNNGLSLADAFEKPVRASNGSGYVEPSILALSQYWDQTETAYDLHATPVVAVLNPHGFELPSKALARAQVQKLSQWIEVITDLLGEA